MNPLETPVAAPTAIPLPTATAEAILGLFAPNDPLFPIVFNIGKALVFLVIALVLASSAKRWIVRLMTRGKRVNLNAASLVGNLVQVGVVALGIINLLVAFGVDIASLVTVLGVAGLAISLSLQDLLRNVVAGIYVLMEQPFKIGDRVSVKEITGKVQSIELRTTILQTDDGLQVVVPNNTMLNEIVINRSASRQQKAAIRVRIAGESATLQETVRSMNETLANVEGVTKDPAPAVSIDGIHEGTARLRVEFWFPTGEKATAAANIIAVLRSQWPEANMAMVEG